MSTLDQRSAQAPDIIVILIDDLGVRDLAAFGSTFYETPTLDRLSQRGVHFEHSYAAAPVCSPTRAALMTGRAPARVGLTQYIPGESRGRLEHVPYLHYLPKGLLTLPAALRQGGYTAWHVGKWHLGDAPSLPTDHGFECNIGGKGWGMPKYGHIAPWKLDTLIPEGADGDYLADRLTDEAIKLVRQHRKAHPDQPYFLNLWHYAVHIPLQAPKDLVDKYTEKARRLGLDRIDPIVVGEAFPCDHKKHERIERRMVQSHAVYAAMIENLDTNIGRLWQAVQEAGNGPNTLLWFTSDNGGLSSAEGSPTCNLPFHEGKGWVYDGGTRVSQIVHWPMRLAPQRCLVPTTSTDLFPTLLEAAGLPQRPADHCDGESILGILTGERSTLTREALFWHYPHYSNQGGRPASSIRCGSHKLIEFFEDGSLELYDLDNDPSEQRNLASTQPELVTQLHRRLVQWRADICASIPEPNPCWQTPAEPPPGDPATV